MVIAGLVTIVSSASAEEPDAEGSGVAAPSVLAAEDFGILGPRVSVPPARFAGWFQPWVVALLVGVPLSLAALERRHDLSRWLRKREWRKRSGPE